MNALNTRIPEGAKLVKYTVTMGKRTARFYVCEQTLNLRQFIFRNAYNCRESITFVSAQTTKTVSKSSTAVCGDVMTQYDVRHTRSFEEQTPVLQKSRALFLAEFLTSPQIFLPIDSVEHEVLITDYKHEVSDNPGEGNIIKFEWQFASLRYPLTDDEYTRFFSSQYSEPFA